ncbi:DNA-binding transcriptional activator [Belliella sp. DSM 111904]|uniref:DNA-binding transcriptional activator n=1 Tax=Belliella filtrata TaxID=2923435 RepID=A0ABS9UWG9_9BACT|nr:DNA-binding transcriptional activator [Belliella filtrata]MCH7408515.1 DNA-binding transcriptional activator [Belliella filtrata]
MASSVFVLLGSGKLFAQDQSPGGLMFQSSDQPINQRTSYDVFGDKSIAFVDKFDLNFSLSLYPSTEIGYIFRIKNKDSNKVFNLFYNGEGSDLVFTLSEEGTSVLTVARMNKEELLDLHWFDIKVQFNLQEKFIDMTIHDQTFHAASPQLPEKYTPVILFGKSDHIIDVPSFAIKNLMVGNETKYIFPLKEVEGSVVHEIENKVLGRVLNPEWMMNDAYHWKYLKSFNSQSVAGSNYNPITKDILYFNKDSIQFYNVRSGQLSLKIFEEQCPVQLKLGTNYIDYIDNTLNAYEVYYDVPYSGSTFAKLDLETLTWTVKNDSQLPTQLHHHGTFYNNNTQDYTIFGGFGNMHYSKNFYVYKYQDNDWGVLDGFTGDLISPRYFSSMGYLEKNNSLYVFGGMGNESGEQTVGRRYYYDLYQVNLSTNEVTKLWEIPWENDNMVPVRGMVLLDENYFYTLCYPEHFSESKLRLYKFSISDGSFEILGDSIPIFSDKINTHANLYYDQGLNNLYALVQEFDDDISSELKVYSLAFPPVTAQQLASFQQPNSKSLLYQILGVLIFAIISVGTILLIRKKRRLKAIEENQVILPSNALEFKPVERYYRPNAIYLFGEFTVRDRKNRDITYMFSTQLKQILCLVIQYSISESGITSQYLSNVFWPDKPANKVKNSRGVSINNLRKALNELDGIELIYEKGHFKIVYTDEFYCDYFRCHEIVGLPGNSDARREMIEIIGKGKFLHFFDHPIFDSFKDTIEKELEPYLLLAIEKSFTNGEYKDSIAIADAIFNIDPLSEIAINYQVQSFHKLKHHDEAKIKLESFMIRYKKVMGSDYPNPYKLQ